MRTMLHKVLGACAGAVLLALALAAGPVPSACATAQDASTGAEASEVETSLAKAVGAVRELLGVGDGESIYTSELMQADDSTAQWLAYDFMRLGVDTDAHTYLDALKSFVTEKYASPPTLIDASFSSEWNRLSIVIKGLGGDPTAFGTDANGKTIDLVADGSYNWIQPTEIGVQGSNGWVYALHAVNATGTQVPEGARYSRETMIQELLSYQNENGSFSLQGRGEDLDITAMAICALSAYADSENVYTSVSRALAFLSKAQGPDGRFRLSLGPSAEAQAQAVMALCAAGIDPRTNPDFVKNEGNALSGLLMFQLEDGGFRHDDETTSENMDPLATEQSMRALIAVEEMDNGADGNVYTADIALSLPGVTSVAPPPSAAQIAFWVAVGVIAALVVVAVLYVRHRMKKRRAA